jgi:hypothetical protein
MGAITGIPGQFTTNGAVVNDEGKVVVTSSNAASGFYAIDIKTLVATPIENSVAGLSISDLANANLIEGKKTDNKTEDRRADRLIVKNDNVNIYPNPITTSQFKLNFEEMTKGNYVVTVTDLMGRQVYNKRVVVQNESQIETINMGTKPSNGLYLVKIADASGKDVYVGKLVVE